MTFRKPIKIVRHPQARVFNSRRGWQIIAKRRIYFRSQWEYLYALYLQWQKEQKLILEWEYEPKTFWFEKIKRGVTSYKPDFMVSVTSSERYWVEVKGYMDKRSIVKLKRFKRYFPQERIVVIDKAWFDRRWIKAPACEE